MVLFKGQDLAAITSQEYLDSLTSQKKNYSKRMEDCLWYCTLNCRSPALRIPNPEKNFSFR